MEFLDPKYERRSHLQLLIGYCLVGLAIAIATLVLLYQAYGYTIDRQGEVTQSGLVFVSSQPNGAAVYLNDKRYKSNTDTRMVIPAGKYTLRISETGYRPWERPIFIGGGDVQHFDYPFLFPETLHSSALADFSVDPPLATQSPDRRWLLLASAETPGTFTRYDFKNPDKPAATPLTLPAGSFTPGTGAQTWSLVEWAADNRHVLLLHTFVTGSSASREYILVDRDTPADSVDLSTSLNLTQAQTVNLFNNRTDQLYIYNAADQTLRRTNRADGTVASTLEHILAFKPYGDDRVLYVTDQSPTGKATPGLVSVVLQTGQQTVTLRTLPAAGSGGFVLDLAQYSGDWYVAAASSADSAVYLYKNPQDQTTTGTDTYPTPFRRLSLKNPSYLDFSDNTQFLLAESGQNFVVYDFENIAQHSFMAADPIDAPQPHATWMDGNRLAYVSGGNLTVVDYDNRNKQTLVAANPAFAPFFAPDYSYLYALQFGTPDAKPTLSTTPLTVQQ